MLAAHARWRSRPRDGERRRIWLNCRSEAGAVGLAVGESWLDIDRTRPGQDHRQTARPRPLWRDEDDDG